MTYKENVIELRVYLDHYLWSTQDMEVIKEALYDQYGEEIQRRLGNIVKIVDTDRAMDCGLAGLCAFDCTLERGV